MTDEHLDVTHLLRREPWMADAACRGLDTAMFFTERGESTTDARRVCAGCPVRLDCLAYGLDEKFGIWGGRSERERRRMRRIRNGERETA